MPLVPVKVALALQTPGGSLKIKRVVPFVPLSIGSACCGYGLGWGSGGDPAIAPSEKKK